MDLICEYIPLVVQILGSKVTSDVLEAINFLSKCASFGISAAQPGVQRSLGLVWSGDATVRKAVLDVHVQLYLDSQEEVCVCVTAVVLVECRFHGYRVMWVEPGPWPTIWWR